MTPRDVLYDTILYSWASSRPMVPGAIVLSRPKEVREQLAKLKSKDIANVRIDTFMETNHETRS